MSKTPPKYPLRFFRWFCNPEYAEDIEGDLLERFEKKPSKWLFAIEVLKLFRPEVIKKTEGNRKINYYGMFKNYVKIAPRIFLKNKLVSSISLLSLVIGTVSFQLIFSWVDNELNTNKFHKNLDDIYAVMLQTNPMVKPQPSRLDVDPEDYTMIESSLSILPYAPDEGKLMANEKEYRGITWVVDSTFFTFFDFEFIHGNSFKIFENPHNIVISDSFSKKVFGGENPIGKVVKSFTDGVGQYKVAGVLAPFPSTSSMKFDVLIPRHSSKRWSVSPKSFVLANHQFDQEEFNNLIKNKSIYQHQYKEGALSTIPLQSIYFEHIFSWFIYDRYGNINQVRIMSAVALIILFICSVNFTNLQTIFHLSNTKQLGIRQVNGATKVDLFFQDVVSKGLLFLIAFSLSLLLLVTVSPPFERVIGIEIDFDLVKNILVLTTTLAVIIGLSILISAFQIRKIRATEAFQNKILSARIPKLQKFFTVIQYSISCFLIIASTTIYLQYNHLTKKDLGYNQKDIISVDFFDELIPELYNSREESNAAWEEQKNQFQYIKNELSAHPDILTVSQGDLPIMGSSYPMSWKLIKDNEEFNSHNLIACGPNYKELLDLKVLQGRFFSEELDEDRDNKVVINRAAADFWNIKSLENVKLSCASWGDFQVIGVVENFNYKHLSSDVKPLIMANMTDIEEPILIKMRENYDQKKITFIEGLFKEVNPGRNFNYISLELELREQYAKERMIGRIYFAFTVVGLSMSLIGLLAFAVYENERRTKEVGIRKVHGASMWDIFLVLSNSLLRIVSISIAIVIPIGWYLMERWLENYSYRIDMKPSIFLLTITLGVSLALITVAWRTIKTANVNPARILRDE